MASKLNDTQLTILAVAAARDDLHVLPLPDTLRAPAVAVTKTLRALIARGLVVEVATSRDDALWRETERTHRVTLVITPAGLAAIGIREERAATAPAEGRTSAKVGKGAGKPAKAARRATTAYTAGDNAKVSKQDAVIALLRRQQGASIAEMMAATEWQAHSVRGFMSGALKKRLGLEVISEKDGTGERRYFVAALNTR